MLQTSDGAPFCRSERPPFCMHDRGCPVLDHHLSAQICISVLLRSQVYCVQLFKSKSYIQIPTLLYLVISDGGVYLKASTQWNLVGMSTAVLTFASFFVFMYCGPLQGTNLLLLGFGHPLLMMFYLPFSFMSFVYGYLESRKEPKLSVPEEREIVFIKISPW